MIQVLMHRMGTFVPGDPMLLYTACHTLAPRRRDGAPQKCVLVRPHSRVSRSASTPGAIFRWSWFRQVEGAGKGARAFRVLGLFGDFAEGLGGGRLVFRGQLPPLGGRLGEVG